VPTTDAAVLRLISAGWRIAPAAALLLASTWTAQPLTAQDAAAIIQEARPRDAAALSQQMTRRYSTRFEELGIGGVVRLEVFVTAAGTADTVRISSSSGVLFLDNAASSVVRAAEFVAAQDAAGAVGSWTELELVFGDADIPLVEPPRLADRPRQLERIQSIFPADLRRTGVDVPVVLILTVDDHGAVTEVQAPGAGCFPSALEAGLQAARELAFEPVSAGTGVVRTSFATLSFTVDSVGLRVLGEGDPPPNPRAAGEAARPGGATTRRPELRNMAVVRQQLNRRYMAGGVPPATRAEVRVRVYIDERGSVVRRALSEPSGDCRLDHVALDVARLMRFSPALRDGKPVKVWIEVPLFFGVR
jgi:TonB family protein